MAISCLMVHWLNHIKKAGFFKQGESLLEFGPQDITASKKTVESVAYENVKYDASWIIQNIFDGDIPKFNTQKYFYKIFGFNNYKSLDAFDRRADYRYDLNYLFDPASEYKYDLNYVRAPSEKFFSITNFGTSEHCFNIAASFHTAHNFLQPGGIFLYVLPAFGHINHGFYNIHPNVYTNLAIYNDYEILDFRYIDNFGVRCLCVEQDDYKPFDFENLPIKYNDTIDDGIKKKVADLFVKNALSEDTKKFSQVGIFDYCFVALRKKNEKPFKIPSQY